MAQKMTAKLCPFDPKNFPHLGAEEILVINSRIENHRSLSFIMEGKKTFYVIIDLDKESVHVRRIGGAFAWCWNFIMELCVIIAHHLELKKVTVIADKNFMIFAVKKLGFRKADGFLYEKVIA